jgi:hypothetical protein
MKDKPDNHGLAGGTLEKLLRPFLTASDLSGLAGSRFNPYHRRVIAIKLVGNRYLLQIRKIRG